MRAIFFVSVLALLVPTAVHAAPSLAELEAAPAAAVNLAPNPSFETGSGNQAHGWQNVSWCSRVAKLAHSGTHSLEVTAGGFIGFPHIDSNHVPVTAAVEYEFSVFALQDAAQPLRTGHSAMLKVVWMGAGGFGNQTG